MNLQDIITRAEAIREAVASRVVRQSQVDLYAALANALGLCEACEAEGLTDALRQEVIARGQEGGKRSYFEQSADVYLIVGRLIFSDGYGKYGSRCNAWRYTATMREAHKRQIRSAGLVEWLSANGGVNALYNRRPVQARTMTRRTLHLTSPVTIEKGKPFTLTLVSNSEGFFDVVGVK